MDGSQTGVNSHLGAPALGWPLRTGAFPKVLYLGTYCLLADYDPCHPPHLRVDDLLPCSHRAVEATDTQVVPPVLSLCCLTLAKVLQPASQLFCSSCQHVQQLQNPTW
jgi:hypothetical protein